jgi:tetratricopeptide (TPR) repeat protein
LTGPKQRSLLLLLSLLILEACASSLRELPPLSDPRTSAPDPGKAASLLARAEILYATRAPADVREAARHYLEAARENPPGIAALIGAARTGVWLADHEAAPAHREDAAGRAVDAARWCAQAAPADAACDYWLGAALGVQARERRTTALDALPRIEAAFRRAAERDPLLDQAGPHRALALLYLRAPGWPTGPGDPDRGLEEARKAVELRPDHPPNRLALAEALLAAGDKKEAMEVYRQARDAAAAASAAGDLDAAEWLDVAEKALADSGEGP